MRISDWSSDVCSSDLLLDQRLGLAGIALAREGQIDRQPLGGEQHPLDMPGAGRAGGRVGAGRGAGPAADHRRDARGDGFLDLLRADAWDMRVDAPGGDQLAFPRYAFVPPSDYAPPPW